MKRRITCICSSLLFAASVGCGGEELQPSGPFPEIDPNQQTDPNLPTMPDPTPMPDPNPNPMPEPEPEPEPQGLPVLGAFSHSVDNVIMTWIGTSADALLTPRDLAFNPAVPGELWVVNRPDHSVVVFNDVGTPSQTSMRYWGAQGAHFLAQPAALAFGALGTFATIHETDDLTQGPFGTPEDFMGPTLWTADRSVFDAGHIGHLDMLHNSPNGMGIAWERDNVYWVFDGFHSSLTRYDFAFDHGPGGADHSDGIIQRFVQGEVLWVENVPSHMEIDRASNMLYFADTGNNRIGRLNTLIGVPGPIIAPNYDGVSQYRMMENYTETVVNGAALGMVHPSGLALRDGLIFVTDNATGVIYAFTMDGQQVDWLPTGLPAGALMGIDFDANGNLYAVDAVSSAVIRIEPKI